MGLCGEQLWPLVHHGAVCLCRTLSSLSEVKQHNRPIRHESDSPGMLGVCEHITRHVAVQVSKNGSL